MNAPVMLLFFNRPEPLKKVFEAVRRARPSQLFLVQDGARDNNPDDPKNIQLCRNIVATVDWPCQVYRNYADSNMSCDHREYTGISWCFQYVDRLIVLEDDCLPSPGFFLLCEELLEKYKDSPDIQSISGFNRLQSYQSPYSYIFSKSGAGLGWATWKRVWDKTAALKNLDFVEDEAFVQSQLFHMDPSVKAIYGDIIAQGKRFKEQMEKTNRIPSWEFLFGACLVLNNMLVITPTKNMVKYLGITEDATHSHSDARLLVHKVRKVLTQPSFDISLPIKHPPFVVRDVNFEKLSKKAMYTPPVLSHIESVLLKIRYGRWDLLAKAFVQRFKKSR